MIKELYRVGKEHSMEAKVVGSDLRDRIPEDISEPLGLDSSSSVVHVHHGGDYYEGWVSGKNENYGHLVIFPTSLTTGNGEGIYRIGFTPHMPFSG